MSSKLKLLWSKTHDQQHNRPVQTKNFISLYYFIKTQHDIIFEKFCLTKFFNSSMVKVADIYYILREKRYIYYINYRFHESLTLRYYYRKSRVTLMFCRLVQCVFFLNSSLTCCLMTSIENFIFG